MEEADRAGADVETAKIHAAARELLEECGVLLARRGDGSRVNEPLNSLRDDLIKGRTAFDKELAANNWTIDRRDFQFLGRMVTPPFTTLRFDTTFYLAQLPPGQTPEVWPGELEEGRWAEPIGALHEWLLGESLVAPPSLALLQCIRGRSAPEWALRLENLMNDWFDRPLPPIFFSPEVQMLPLKTVALPPSTHTNAFLVGRDPAYLIDPGAADPDEQEKLFQAVDLQIALGRHLAALVLSHHHPDHWGAAAACAERYGVPIWAHPWTRQKLADSISTQRDLNEGSILDLGTAPGGQGSWHLECLHTPGHAPGHLAFYEPRYQLLFAADLVSPQTSMIIAPPDGDLAVYLQSLRRIQNLPCRLLLPAHGGPTAQPGRLIADALELRAKRERQLLEALATGAKTIRDLVDEVYRGVPGVLMDFAERQVLAGLTKLEQEGRAQRESPEATKWRLCRPSTS